MKTVIQLLKLFTIMIYLVGCGQTGPLYLPDQKPLIHVGS